VLHPYRIYFRGSDFKTFLRKWRTLTGIWMPNLKRRRIYVKCFSFFPAIFGLFGFMFAKQPKKALIFYSVGISNNRKFYAEFKSVEKIIKKAHQKVTIQNFDKK
jgi:hypothetical protein